jgi:hypothetical protein
MAIKQSRRVLVLASATIAAAIWLTVPNPAEALDTGAAVGIGLGSFALGTALGAASNPYYGGYYGGYAYPYGYYPAAPAYYPPPAPYYGLRSCWDPYYRRYYAC